MTVHGINTHVIVIHEDASIRMSVMGLVRTTEYKPVGASDLAQARACAPRAPGSVSVVMTEVTSGHSAGKVIDSVRAEWPNAEVIVVGPSEASSDVADAVRQGAADYVPVASLSEEPERLLQAVRAAGERRREARSHARTSEDAPFDSRDPLMRDVFARAERAARVDTTVLITGESGTGKEVLARHLHRLSTRSRFKFVPVNCGSLPESLIETELFGYRKGAFTGAHANTRGLVEEAEHGILFLDEIGDMPLPMQVRLLRFLDGGEVRPVGGRVVRHVDVRIVAATNKVLDDEMRAKRFREDLFFRLNVVPLHLPPLRDRKVDIPALVQRHVHRAASRLSLAVPVVAPRALAMLVDYDWPGNIRELQNAAEYAVVQCLGGVITADTLPCTITRRARMEPRPAPAYPRNVYDQVVVALQQYSGNHGQAAAALGISRTTLWRRLRQVHGASPLPSNQDS